MTWKEDDMRADLKHGPLNKREAKLLEEVGAMLLGFEYVSCVHAQVCVLTHTHTHTRTHTQTHTHTHTHAHTHKHTHTHRTHTHTHTQARVSARTAV